MWTTFAVIAAGLSSEAAGDVTAAPPPPPPPAPLIALSAGFGSGMVLQHSTPVAIYGVVNATGGTPASVQVTVAGGDVYSVAAVVTGSTWKASLRPAPAGHTEYSITVTCVAGCNGAVFRNQTEVVIDRVVYGHVWCVLSSCCNRPSNLFDSLFCGCPGFAVDRFVASHGPCTLIFLGVSLPRYLDASQSHVPCSLPADPHVL